MPIKDFWIAILRLKWTTRHLTDSMIMVMMMEVVAAAIIIIIIIIIIVMTTKSYKICSCTCWVRDITDSDHGDSLSCTYSILLKM